MEREAEITRLAIEEIVRGMHYEKPKETLRPAERKLNPLGKPNKRFLGRTINSILQHNKRENDRTQASCREKLRELEEKRRSRKIYEKRHRKYKHKRRDKVRSQHRPEITSSSSSDENVKKPKVPMRHKRKRKTQSSTCNDGDDRSNGYQYGDNSELRDKTTSDDVLVDTGYYLHQNSLALASAVAYNQMQQVYQVLCGTAAEAALATEDVTKADSIASVDGDSDSIAFESSSSTEANEHGMLTIDVSSDESMRSISSKFKSKSQSYASSNSANCIKVDSDSSNCSSSVVFSCSSDSNEDALTRKTANEQSAIKLADELIIELTDD